MYLNVELIHALEPSERRCFNRREAASYVAVSTGTFDKLVKLGIMPMAIELFGRRKVWDRASLDEAVDTLAGRSRPNISAPGLAPRSADLQEELDRELEEFRSRHGRG